MGRQGIKIVVFCPEPVESGRLAGPNIRSAAMARELAGRFQVTLAVPGETDYFRGEPFATRSWTRHDTRKWIGEYDVALSLGFDLYAPVLFEILASDSHEAHKTPYHTRFLGRMTALLLKRADYILCASPQQRDLWLGSLYVAREFSSRKNGSGPGELIGIVPFGHDGSHPIAADPVLKGVHPGIGPDDKVLLWGGGIWNWLDPLTLVDAMNELSETHPEVKLFFLGMRPPEASEEASEIARHVVIRAQKLELLGENIFFNEQWVPFEERAGYLLESDLALCTSPEGLENKFSFRTRLVDAVWAGLPIVCTRGSSMADLVESNDIGLSAREKDPSVLKEKILAALEPKAQKRFRENMTAAREELLWKNCVKPLMEFCETVENGAYHRPKEKPWKPWCQYLAYKIPTLLEKIIG